MMEIQYEGHTKTTSINNSWGYLKSKNENFVSLLTQNGRRRGEEEVVVVEEEEEEKEDEKEKKKKN